MMNSYLTMEDYSILLGIIMINVSCRSPSYFSVILLVGIISGYLTPNTLSRKLYELHPVVCIESTNMAVDAAANERDLFQSKKHVYIYICIDFMLHVSTYIQVI
jgi:hypothetical protein